MTISGINPSTNAAGSSSASKSKDDESIEQLAAQGDPIAIAELKEQQQQQSPAQQGATEPGKGEQVDHYV